MNNLNVIKFNNLFKLSQISLILILFFIITTNANSAYKTNKIIFKNIKTNNVNFKTENKKILLADNLKLIKIKNSKTIDFDDHTYVGQVNKDNIPHGKGSYVINKGKRKGDEYDGEFYNGSENGMGTYKWSTGEKFVGQFKMGKRYKGLYTYANGDTFEGEYLNDKMHYGTVIFKDAGEYTGYFKNELFHGKGKIIWKNGDTFEGELKEGLKSEGIYTYKLTGDTFKGKYKKGQMHYGTFIFNQLGDIYTGFFKDDKRSGKGTYKWKNGDIYEGDWLNESQNGRGIYKYANGKVYEGEFKNGLRDGFGTLIFTDGKKSEGLFKEDEFIGNLGSTEKKIAKNFTSNEKYYALVIGNNNYKYLEKLDAAENDAIVIADILKKNYNFEVKLLLNADYDTTVNSLFKITKKLRKDDNLLIYYAGHGELDKAENRGYWLPVDASYEMRSKWVSNQIIVDRIKATKAKHVLLIADSCFSGTLMRSSDMLKEQQSIDQKYIERLKNKKTRLVITSGGNEPVVDSDGGNHSLFALKLIDTLKNNNEVINSQILFENIRRYVVANADQTPERAMVHKTGHDGGDFLFFPVN